MRVPYVAPKVELAGSVTDLTQANIVGPQVDSATLVTVIIGGVSISVPGSF